MYHEKFGTNAESEDEAYDSQLQRYEKSLRELEILFALKYGHNINDVDEDGCMWIETAGHASRDTLEEKLAEVKCLYHEKFGTDVGLEDETYDLYEDLLNEVQALYVQQYGHVDDDLDEDGCMWSQTDACGNVCDNTELQPLQVALDTVKALFCKKYGHDVDAEEF